MLIKYFIFIKDQLFVVTVIQYIEGYRAINFIWQVSFSISRRYSTSSDDGRVSGLYSDK